MFSNTYIFLTNYEKSKLKIIIKAEFHIGINPEMVLGNSLMENDLII